MADNATMKSVIGAIHAANARVCGGRRFVLAASGGGASGIAELLAVSGASASVLSCAVPYAREATDRFVGGGAEHGYSSAHAARSLASASLRDAKSLLAASCDSVGALVHGPRPCGVGVAAALRSEPMRRGQHVVHAAATSDDAELACSVRLRKGARGRDGEERVAGAALVDVVTHMSLQPTTDTSGSTQLPSVLEQVLAELDSGVVAPADGGAEELPEEVPQRSTAPGAGALPLDALLAADAPTALAAVTHVVFAPPAAGDGPAAWMVNAPLQLLRGVQPPPATAAAAAASASPCPGARLLVVPGSFNPFHEGHAAMAAAAARTAARLCASSGGTHASGVGNDWQVVFELSVTNVDKPPLSSDAILARLAQFMALPAGITPGSAACCVPLAYGAWPVVLTRAPRFLDKAALFPSASFVIGYDTAVRLVHPKYYGDSVEAMVEALYRLYLTGTRFFVGGRLASAAPLPALPSASTSTGAAATATAAAPAAPAAEAFLTLEHLLPHIPSLLRPLFIGIAEADFRVDVSSTQLRKQAATMAATAGAAAVASPAS